MKRRVLFLSILGLLGVNQSYGNLASSAVTKFQMPIYAFYTSADPTCQTGLTALMPMTSTPTTVDFIAGTTIGSGAVASPVNCIVAVFQNSLSYGWAAGTYTTTTNGNPDSNCNAGNSSPPAQHICNGVSQVISTPPAQVSTDAAAAGLTLQSGHCPASPTGNEVIVAYLSTYSVCTGISSTDTTNGVASTCIGSSGWEIMNAYSAPTATGSANGLKLTSIPAVNGGTIYFVNNPGSMVGATSSSSCGNAGPSQMTVHQ